ncbi:MAG: DUF1465 family protein [Bauldia sp.]
MSNDSGDRRGQASETVLFAKRLAGSAAFRNLFHEGMALVEEAAGYLDGPGRVQSKALSRAGSLTFATESMRLTTRLMQIASWLLLQRAVNEGEMSAEQAELEKGKVRLRALETVADGPGWDDLPLRLRDLVTRSRRLQDRVKQLDSAMNPTVAAAAADNQVSVQLSRLEAAFQVAGSATLRP